MMRASQTWLKRSTFLAVAGIALAVSPTNIFATALPLSDSGILEISNLGGALVGITTSPVCINWGGGSTCVAGTTHQMSVSGVSNLFSTAPSATDQIKDLPSFPPPTLTVFQTVLGAGAVAAQTINFDLTSVLTNGGFGNCASNAPLNSCSPPNSPFTFSEDATGTQVALSFTVTLNAYTGTSATGATAYIGVFSTQQSGTLSGTGACNGLLANITNILACEAAGGTINATWSATESPVPSTTKHPAITKTFGASTIPLNGSTSLSFTITNPNAAVSLSGVAFMDTLPAGMVVATPNGLSTTCGPTTAVAGSGSVSLSAGSLAGGASCTISLNVTGTTSGTKNNSVTVTSTEGGTGNTSNASLTVLMPNPPSITKAFADAQIQLFGSSNSTTLSFTLTNPNTVTTLTGLAFTDTLPSGLIVSTPNGLAGSCGGGTITALAGANSISLSGATLDPSASCTFSVNVTGTEIGVQTNTTSTVTSNEAVPGDPATASTSVNDLFFFWFFAA
jgi:hypothetical protein